MLGVLIAAYPVDRRPRQAVAAMPSVTHARSGGPGDTPAGPGDLAGFRWEFYTCLTARADELFELADAVLCAQGPVRSLAELSLEPEHRRGHGGLYDGLNAGRIGFARLRRILDGLPLPRVGGRIVLGVDVTPWLRPDAETSPDRLFCHVHGRAKGASQMIPGWPYSIVAALAGGRSSWTAVLDAVRLGPDDDATAVTAGQLRDVVTRLIAAGHWRPGDPEIEIVMDTGYDVTRLAFVLAELPVILTGRLRSDRVMLRPAPPRRCGQHRAPTPARAGPRSGPAGHLARPRPGHDDPDHPLRPGDSVGLAPDAPAADPPRPVAGPPRGRGPADHRGHPGPAAGRAPAR